MNRLQVILSTGPETKTPTPPPPPADAPQAFAQECRRLLGQHLVACEERFAAEESGSTLTVIVDRDAASWLPRLEEVRQKLFSNLAQDEPTRLVVMDRSTVEILESLQAAGLIQRSERASRPLDGITPALAPSSELSEAQKQQIADLLPKLEHRHKVAKTLLAAELHEDAAPPLTTAMLHACSILAVRHGLPLPADENAMAARPWLALWTESAREALTGPASTSDPHRLATLCSECERIMLLARQR